MRVDDRPERDKKEHGPKEKSQAVMHRRNGYAGKQDEKNRDVQNIVEPVQPVTLLSAKKKTRKKEKSSTLSPLRHP